MKTKDVLIVGGIAVILYLLWKKSAQGGGAGAHGGGSGGGAGSGGCGCGPSTAQLNPWTGGVIGGCPSASPGIGNWTQGAGPYPPEAFTNYNPPSGEAWNAPGFHLGFDLTL
jgi:hypothetical protein